ncbi:hypothetical protein ACKKBG_A25665 [Auxenochlorella protothecoides x Auxenochlorella symbiontica]
MQSLGGIAHRVHLTHARPTSLRHDGNRGTSAPGPVRLRAMESRSGFSSFKEGRGRPDDLEMHPDPFTLPSQVHAPARRRSSIHAAEHGLTDVWTGDAFFKSGGLAVAALVLIALTH